MQRVQQRHKTPQFNLQRVDSGNKSDIEQSKVKTKLFHHLCSINWTFPPTSQVTNSGVGASFSLSYLSDPIYSMIYCKPLNMFFSCLLCFLTVKTSQSMLKITGLNNWTVKQLHPQRWFINVAFKDSFCEQRDSSNTKGGQHSSRGGEACLALPGPHWVCPLRDSGITPTHSEPPSCLHFLAAVAV